jgi:hypothetical protein
MCSFFLYRMYPLILSFETINKLKVFLNAVFPRLKMWDTFACASAKKLTLFIISIALLKNVPPDAGLQKRATISNLNIGLDGPGIKPGPSAWQAAALTAQPSTTPKHVLHCDKM